MRQVKESITLEDLMAQLDASSRQAPQTGGNRRDGMLPKNSSCCPKSPQTEKPNPAFRKSPAWRNQHF